MTHRNLIKITAAILFIVIQNSPLTTVQAMENSPITETTAISPWQKFREQNPSSPFSLAVPELIVYIKQNLDPHSRINLAMTCWGMQNAVYDPKTNEFVLEGWEYLERLHKPWKDLPPMPFRTLSILNGRVMTILGLHINMGYEPKMINVDPGYFVSYLNLGDHNKDRLKWLCEEIKETPFSILPEECFLRNYVEFLICNVNIDISNMRILSNQLEHKIVAYFNNTMCLVGNFESLKNETTIFRHLRFFAHKYFSITKKDYYLSNGYVSFTVGNCYMTTNPECSIFEVLKNYEAVKKLKETPDLYIGNTYAHSNHSKLKELALVWKSILALDYGATLLSCRLGFFSNFSSHNSHDNLSYAKRALCISKKDQNKKLEDLGPYCEGLCLLKDNNDFEHLLEGIEEVDTIGYANYSMMVSNAYKSKHNYKKNIIYCERAKKIYNKINHPFPTCVYEELSNAYEKTAQFDKAIYYWKKFYKNSEPDHNNYWKLADLYNKNKNYLKAGKKFEQGIKLYESKIPGLPFFQYELAAHAFCNGGDFETAAYFMNKYINVEVENDIFHINIPIKIPSDKYLFYQGTTINLLAQKYDEVSLCLNELQKLTAGKFDLFIQRIKILHSLLTHNLEGAKEAMQTIQKHILENPKDETTPGAKLLIAYLLDQPDLIDKAIAYAQIPHSPEDWMTPFYLALKYDILYAPHDNDLLTQEGVNEKIIWGWMAIIWDIQTALIEAKENGFCW